MKKLLLSLFIFISYQSAFAQDDSKMDFGFRFGGSFSFIGELPDEYDQDGTKVGFVGGAFARFKTGATGFYFQPEVNFAQSGGRSKIEVLGVVSEYSTTITSVDVPFLVGVRFGTRKLGIHAHAGPVLSGVLSARTKSKIASVESSSTVTDDLNRLQAGIQIGAGVDLGPVLVGLRYQGNLTNTYKDNSIPDFFSGDSKINLFQLSLSVKLF